MRVIYRNLGLSLTYNIVGSSLAIMGYVSPLMAAVFMPISSLTVVISTFYGTAKLNKLKVGQEKSWR